MSAPLSPKREAFCREYVIDLNATQAAIRAGYAAKSAAVTGCRLLRDANVRARINELMDVRNERTGITAEQVIEELASVGLTSNLADYIEQEPDGAIRVRDLSALPAEKQRALRSIRMRTTRRIQSDGGEVVTTTTEISLWDRLAALKLLGEHYRLFVDGPHEADEGRAREYEITMVIPLPTTGAEG
ncbi:MAG TPA: terminase small subunit [Gemmatimonadaceae bacterium]|nr:terminase small subunit [Gemmatimonadaceae bacterium]